MWKWWFELVEEGRRRQGQRLPLPVLHPLLVDFELSCEQFEAVQFGA